MLREYKLQNKEWDGSCSSIYRSKENGDEIVLVHRLGYYHYAGLFPPDREEKVKACVKHTRRFLTGVRKKGFVVSRRQKHTSLGRGGWYDFWKISLQKASNSNFFTKRHFLRHESDRLSHYLKSAIT
jgi:hypothetical protein